MIIYDTYIQSGSLRQVEGTWISSEVAAEQSGQDFCSNKPERSEAQADCSLLAPALENRKL
jgi:hypothetical protein